MAPQRVRALALAITVVFFGGLISVSTHSVFGTSGAGDQALRTAGGTDGAASNGASPVGASGTQSTSEATVPSSTDAGSRVAGSTGGAGVGTSVVTRAAGQSTRGTTATGDVKIGFWIIDVASGCQTLGVKGGTCADQAPYIKAAVDYANSHGGMAGHRIVPVIYRNDGSTSGTWAAQAAAACASLIEDQKVFAVMASFVGGRDFFASCAASHQTPVIDPGYWPFDSTDYQRLGGYLYQPSRPKPERWLAAYVDGLADQGFFTKSSKVGLLRFDDAEFKRTTDAVLKPRLAAHGLALADEELIQTPASASGLGDMSASLTNAVLRLRSAGVDRVLFFDLGSEMSFFYFPVAESQNYHPLYGLNTYQAWQLLTANAPARQLQGARGVGWNPAADVPPTGDPGGTPAAPICKQALSSAGLDAGTGRSIYCDAVFFLQAAMQHAPTFDASGLRRGVEALGTSHSVSTALTATFGPGRYDGPSSYLNAAFDGGCTCFVYQGGLHPMN